MAALDRGGHARSQGKPAFLAFGCGINLNEMEQHTPVRYGSLAQALHWVTAVLVLVTFIYGPGGSEQRVYSPARDFDRQLHETLGMCVFALVVLRVLWRTVDTQPAPPQVPRWMTVGAKAVQGALYLLLFALPLTAITGAWLEGHPLTLLAGVEISPLLGPSHDAGVQIATLHTWLGDAILWLAGFHALAALYHHIILKDGVLASMLPRWFPLRQGKK
jgi:cytochrome b561